MSSLSLTACSFHIKEFNSRGIEKIFSLNDMIDYKGEDEEIHDESIYNLFKYFFNSYSQSINDDDKSKTFNCTFKGEYSGETYRTEPMKYILSQKNEGRKMLKITII